MRPTKQDKTALAVCARQLSEPRPCVCACGLRWVESHHSMVEAKQQQMFGCMAADAIYMKRCVVTFFGVQLVRSLLALHRFSNRSPNKIEIKLTISDVDKCDEWDVRLRNHGHTIHGLKCVYELSEKFCGEKRRMFLYVKQRNWHQPLALAAVNPVNVFWQRWVFCFFFCGGPYREDSFATLPYLLHLNRNDSSRFKFSVAIVLRSMDLGSQWK